MQQRADNLELFAGGGEMGRRMRAHDWTATPLGPVSGWPQSLKTAVRIMLGSRYPMYIWWGRELVNLYNDGYLPMLGKRHPAALGQPAAVVWSEIWDTIGPQTDAVLSEGRATWNEERLLVLERNGYPEETYFTFAYSPVPADDGGVGGVFCALTEDTQRVLGQRRLRTLRELSARATGARTVEQACRAVTDTLAQNPQDLPFALIYLLDGEGGVARLAGATGLPEGSPGRPETLALAAANGQPPCWPLEQVAATGRAELVEGLEARCGRLQCGAWPDPPQSAIVLPVLQSGQERLAGFLVAGISPRRVFDDDYRGFTDLLAGHIATAIANARAYEEEKRRAEALAELDRAKTAFFSNVSHEFRTPLTLMLGPVEDVLADTAEPPTPRQRERLEVAHRNALRLQKLVNTLLDFSRIEAGRVRARFEPTDLAAFTADLASNFRSACEKAGLLLRVDCPPLPEPVYVDRDMWEKVVLNLLSNAFKYTLQGAIEVRLRPADGQVELAVRDTGTGIPAEEMPRLFERFHRVEGSRGRTQEGSGIGLALVRELVRLHGGEVRAESACGVGSVFTVALPLGKGHLPADRISGARTLASTALGAAPFVEEALRWLPDAPGRPTEAILVEGTAGAPLPPARGPGERLRILLADDNADMRDYVRRLLADRYDVTAVADGRAALTAVEAAVPDLILSDVMMPGVDGFGLLRRLRGDPRTREVPVILLSARAGEESRVEGLEAGADDYLTKPFSARELLARVQGHLQMAQLRRVSQEALRRSEAQFRQLADAMPQIVFAARPDGSTDYLNERWYEFTGLARGAFGQESWEPVLHPDDRRRSVDAYFACIQAGRPFQIEHRFNDRRTGGYRWFLSRAVPVRDEAGRVVRWFGTCTDIDDMKRAAEEVERQREDLHSLIMQSPLPICVLKGPDLSFEMVNPAYVKTVGGRELLGKPLLEALPELRGQGYDTFLRDVMRTGAPVVGQEAPLVLQREGRLQQTYFTFIYSPLRNRDGSIDRVLALCNDVTAQKRQNERLRLLWEAATVLLTTDDPDAMLRTLFAKLAPHLALDAYFNFLVRESGDGLRLGSCAGIPDEEVGKITRLDFGQAVCGTVAVRRRPIVATHIQRSDEPMVQLVKGYGIRAYACNPLLVEGRLLGTLSFASRSRDEFDADELEFLRTISHYVTVAFERLRLVRQLRDQDQRKDEFLATLAHELRNPLAPIRNSLQILRMARLDAATLERSRDMMERQVQHLVRLVDDLLDVSRVMRGKIVLRKEPVELASVLARAVETAQPLIEAQRHELTVEIPPEPLPVEADPVRLSQVVANLLANAAKYTDRGGRIELTARRHGDQAVLRVRDTGIGIAPHLLPRIFELFMQVDHATTKAQGGLGIGLTLVKNLVEMHHGTVEAQSAGLGRGSEFIVRLPLTVRKPGQAIDRTDAGPPPPPATPGLGRRLMIVDDNRDAADSLALLLRLQGFEVRVAHDGPAALELVKDYRPEMIFLDLGMPGMDGFEVARRLRRQSGLHDVRLVALTGWGQQEDRRRTAEAGFDRHLVKPVEPKALEDLLDGLIRGPAGGVRSEPQA